MNASKMAKIIRMTSPLVPCVMRLATRTLCWSWCPKDNFKFSILENDGQPGQLHQKETASSRSTTNLGENALAISANTTSSPWKSRWDRAPLKNVPPRKLHHGPFSKKPSILLNSALVDFVIHDCVTENRLQIFSEIHEQRLCAARGDGELRHESCIATRNAGARTEIQRRALYELSSAALLLWRKSGSGSQMSVCVVWPRPKRKWTGNCKK